MCNCKDKNNSIVQREATFLIVHIDSEREDEELVLLQGAYGFDFAFIDSEWMDIDTDYEEGLDFALRFIERLGWKKRHHA